MARDTGEENIDPLLARLIRQSETSGGLPLKDVPDGSVVEVHTRNSVYRIAVADRDRARVAIQRIRGNNQFFTNPELVQLRGSTFGGSVLKIGWIGIGMYLELNTPYGIVATSTIRSVVVKNAPAESAELVAAAQKSTPRETTPAEAADRIAAFVRDKFPASLQPAVRRTAQEFSVNGQVFIVSLLEAAHRHGKFDEAQLVIARFMREHWQYQAPEVRGDPHFTRTNAEYIARAYRELKLPPPGEELAVTAPRGAIVVKTRKSTYRLGPADADGMRTVSRDEKPLEFSRCTVAHLAEGQTMVLRPPDHETRGEWHTTPVQTILTTV